MGSSGGGGMGSSGDDGTGSSDGSVDSQNQALELQNQVLVQNQIPNLVHLNQSLHMLYLRHNYLGSSHYPPHLFLH